MKVPIYLKPLVSLKGGTIEDVRWIENGYQTPDVFLQVRTVKGDVVLVSPWADPEGNGSGWLQIERVPQGTEEVTT